MIFAAVCACLGGWAGAAGAAHYDWTQTSCRFLGCGWSAPAYWSPAGGPPGSGDSATIDEDVPVVLTSAVSGLTALTIENGAALYNAGNVLSVGGGGGNTFLFGTGPTGGNTQLVLTPAGSLGIDFIGRFLSLHLGAELRMLGGGAVTTFGLNVSASSLVSGHGTAVLTASGTRFDVAGTVRPDGGLLTLASYAAGRLDLDGNVGGVEPGHLDVTSTGDLSVIGSLADPFSGTISIGNRHFVDFDTAVTIDGTVEFTTGTGNELVAPSVIFESGALISVDGALGEVHAPTDWRSGTTIEIVLTNDALTLHDDSFFEPNVQISGRGSLVNESGATMTLADGAVLDARVENRGAIAIGEAIGAAAIEDLVQTSGSLLEIELAGADPGSGYDQLIIRDDVQLAGALVVTPVGGFQVSQGQAFTILEVTDTTSGSFGGLPEGGSLGVIGGEELFISYTGGDGNDVVLYTLPEPTFAAGLALASAALFARSRRAGARQRVR